MTPARPGSLTRQLVLAQVLVISAMALTASVVAVLLGPPLFERHLQEAGHATPEILQHGEEAFVSAGLVALVVGITVALLGGIVASVLITRRLGETITDLRRGAERLASGDYATPIALGDDAHELRTVADSLNSLARRVGDTESTRRRVLTDLSHELRTPIATLRVLLEALEDGVATWDAETLATVRQQADRLQRLAADMRDVSAFEEGRLPLDTASASLAELLRAAADAAAPTFADRGVRLDVAPVPDADVAADRVRIGQVLDNLLRNALQHTPAGGRVALRADADTDLVRVVVADDGEGISADDLPHVFERFYRGDRHRRHDEGAGTGVGLTISRAIAEAHGGRLDAASDGPGRGATFTLTLPRRMPFLRKR